MSDVRFAGSCEFPEAGFWLVTEEGCHNVLLYAFAQECPAKELFDSLGCARVLWDVDKQRIVHQSWGGNVAALGTVKLSLEVRVKERAIRQIDLTVVLEPGGDSISIKADHDWPLNRMFDEIELALPPGQSLQQVLSGGEIVPKSPIKTVLMLQDFKLTAEIRFQIDLTVVLGLGGDSMSIKADNDWPLDRMFNEIELALPPGRSLQQVLSGGEIVPKSPIKTVLMLQDFKLTAIIGEVENLVRDQKRKGYPLDDLKASGYPPDRLLNDGFSLLQIRKAGYPLRELLSSGFSSLQIREAGYSVAQWLESGDKLSHEFFNAGYLLEEIFATDHPGLAAFPYNRGADFCCVEGWARLLHEAGYIDGEKEGIFETAFFDRTTAQHYHAGVSAIKLLSYGYTLQELLSGGYTEVQLSGDSYSLAQLTQDDIATLIKYQKLTSSDYTGVHRSGGSVMKLRAAELHKEGIAARRLISAGYTLQEVLNGGYTGTEIYEAGYMLRNLSHEALRLLHSRDSEDMDMIGTSSVALVSTPTPRPSDYMERWIQYRIRSKQKHAGTIKATLLIKAHTVQELLSAGYTQAGTLQPSAGSASS